ncbi:hypothetical protein Syun_019210 [Stephania yunnanensis]|uniref:Uncharacterized protein n=1 Tax=Stephania yunnanensis TaxID=152371 RepID=A0AAP0IVC9_9MAGN
MTSQSLFLITVAVPSPFRSLFLSVRRTSRSVKRWYFQCPLMKDLQSLVSNILQYDLSAHSPQVHLPLGARVLHLPLAILIGHRAGTQSSTPAFGSTSFGQSAFGTQLGGSRIAAYTAIPEADGGQRYTAC